MRRRLTIIAASTLVIANTMAAANAQDAPLASQRPPVQALSTFARPATRVGKNPVQDALAQLKEAESQEEKNTARGQLDEALGKVFDADIERRKSELNAIKRRLAEMEALLKKRVENKESIIALRLQVLTGQAEGLGWPEGNSRSTTGAVYGAVGQAYPSPHSLPSLPQTQPTINVRPAPSR